MRLLERPSPCALGMGGFDESVKGGGFALAHAFEKYPPAVSCTFPIWGATICTKVEENEHENREFSISTDHEACTISPPDCVESSARAVVQKRSCCDVLSAHDRRYHHQRKRRPGCAATCCSVCARRSDRREFRHAEAIPTAHLRSAAAMSARARPCSSRTASPSSASGRACTSASSTVRAIAPRLHIKVMADN